MAVDDTKRQLVPPNNEAPESWLRKYDSRPTILPAWPPSPVTALIMVVKDPDQGGGTYADVVTNQDQLSAVLHGEADAVKRLYFSMPRVVLLRSGVCGLCSEDFEY